MAPYDTSCSIFIIPNGIYHTKLCMYNFLSYFTGICCISLFHWKTKQFNSQCAPETKNLLKHILNDFNQHDRCELAWPKVSLILFSNYLFLFSPKLYFQFVIVIVVSAIGSAHNAGESYLITMQPSMKFSSYFLS